MREQRINVAPFEFLNIIQCRGRVCANQHGYMIIKGHIGLSNEKEYLDLLTKETWVSVNVYDEDDKCTVLFAGMITEGTITAEGELLMLELTIKTGSFLMDLEEHMRTFQNSEITYDKVLDVLLGDYFSNGYRWGACPKGKIGRFLCQYEETDWQFAKRLVSNCGVSVFPNYTSLGVKVYCGLPHGQYQGNLKPTEYNIRQAIEGISYIVDSREVYNIGDDVTFLGKKCYIISRETILKASELCHTYELVENAMPIQKVTYNEKLTGVSLIATVTGVEGSDVMVSIKEDQNKAFCGSRLFPYATVYSSVDGTGWYCMPEEKDVVRVYFPSNREDEAYVMHSVHMDSTNVEERVNPDYKSFMNRQGKELLFKPDSILMTNNNGMSIELSDKEGISIISDKKITIQSDQEIELTSLNERVDIIATEEIALRQGDTEMILSDKLTMRGAKIRLD